MSRLGPEREFTPHFLELTTPARINSKYLTQHKGQTVRLAGKVIKLSGDTAIVEASDGPEVSLVALEVG